MEESNGYIRDYSTEGYLLIQDASGKVMASRRVYSQSKDKMLIALEIDIPSAAYDMPKFIEELQTAASILENYSVDCDTGGIWITGYRVPTEADRKEIAQQGFLKTLKANQEAQDQEKRDRREFDRLSKLYENKAG